MKSAKPDDCVDGPRTWRHELEGKWDGVELGHDAHSMPAGTPQSESLLQVLKHRYAGRTKNGEPLKLGLVVAKHTIQSYITRVRPPKPAPQTRALFSKNHAKDVWACDFVPVIDLWFRLLYLFFMVELASRRIVHCGVTRSTTDAWVAQQLREATPFGHAPHFLIRDRDSKCGDCFTRVAGGTSLDVLKTPYRAPKAMQSATGSRAACGGNAWITSWSWGSCICIA